MLLLVRWCESLEQRECLEICAPLKAPASAKTGRYDVLRFRSELVFQLSRRSHPVLSLANP